MHFSRVVVYFSLPAPASASECWDLRHAPLIPVEEHLLTSALGLLNYKMWIIKKKKNPNQGREPCQDILYILDE